MPTIQAVSEAPLKSSYHKCVQVAFPKVAEPQNDALANLLERFDELNRELQKHLPNMPKYFLFIRHRRETKAFSKLIFYNIFRS